MRRIALLLVAMTSVAGWAQTPAAPAKAPAFDVVSIRENNSDNVTRDFGPTQSGYHMRAMPPAMLLITAFVPSDGKSGLFNPDQIEGMPDWLQTSHYDIEAKVSGEDMQAWKQPEVQRAMLQQLLAERFKLVTHRENREKPVFDLVLAKGGQKFKPSETTDINEIRQKHPGAIMLPGGVAVVPGSQRGETMLFATTMGDLGVFLGKGAGRPIEDKTGLTGKFDLTLTLDMSPGPDGGRPDPISMLMPALQTLGLKLEPAKESIEVLVIDHVERPSVN